MVSRMESRTYSTYVDEICFFPTQFTLFAQRGDQVQR